VFRIIGRGGGADDHAGGVRAVTDNAIRSGCVTAECSEVGDSESELALSSRKPNQTNEYRNKTDFCVHRAWVRLRPIDNLSDEQEQKPLFRQTFCRRRKILIFVRALTAVKRTASIHLRAREDFLKCQRLKLF
jgi:hypothetical protein